MLGVGLMMATKHIRYWAPVLNQDEYQVGWEMTDVVFADRPIGVPTTRHILCNPCRRVFHEFWEDIDRWLGVDVKSRSEDPLICEYCEEELI